MSRRSLTLRALSGIACIGGALLGGAAAHAQTPEPRGLFTAEAVRPTVQLPAEAIAGRSRAVSVNQGQLRSGRFFLSLPGGVSLDAVRDLRQEVAQGKFAWVGHAEGDRNSRVVIGVSGDAVAGSIAYQGRLFKLVPRADGSHLLSEVDARDPAPELDPIPVADTFDLAAESSVTSTATNAADGGPVLDVLVAYTPAVESIYGTAGAEALIIQAVAETNQAYANSGIQARLNLVHTALTNYTESGSMNTDLSRLRGKGDGYMDELHALRDSYGADLVSLVENEPQYCGLGYLMTSPSSSFAASAFSVVHRTCATGYYSFGHEIGHNQGAHHDPANAGSAIYAYAYGHQEPFGSFRTVMAYNCPGGCRRVNHFSNPDVSYNGEPTGVPDVSDNARTIDNTAATVASFRQSSSGTTTPTPTAPSAPADMTAAAVDQSSVQLDWTDTSGEESGFYVERSADGANFTRIASLAANSTSMLDDSLSAETTYFYRTQAWNSVGRSAFSDVAIATTEAAPPQADQRATADMPVAGSVSGDYRNTWTDDGVNQAIREVESGGKRNRRYGYLEHKWAFNVQPGNTIMLSADVRTSAQGESFTFAYSTDGSSYVNMFSVDAASSGTRQFMLPSNLSGTVYLRVRDNVRNRGERTSHAIQVDQLLIRSSNETGAVPTAPDGLIAAAAGDSSVSLSWLDRSATESGFGVERRADGSNLWSQIGTAPADSTAFEDAGLDAGTLYHYRLYAFNDFGESGRSNNASAQTQGVAGGSIELTARGYKTKGRQRADLSWTGASGASVDIYRNGARIAASVSNSGAFTDNINRKGGGSYAYEVCEAGTSSCSARATVVF